MRLMFLLLLGLTSPTYLAPDLESQAALAQKLIEQRVANRWNVGIVVGLVDGDATKIVAAGKQGGDLAAAPDGRTVFEIGSLSKAFTGILLAEAVERKEVGLDQSVADLLAPAVREKFTGDKARITPRHLAQHTSGLARMPNNFRPKDSNNPYADYSAEQMFEYLGSCALNAAPGREYEYSNLAMGLLGHLLAQKAGGDYEATLLKRICEPLGMKETRITLTPEMRARLACGHTALGFETANWDIPTLAGAGAIRSTTEDLLLFAKANLDPAKGPLAAALRRAQSERHRINPELEMGLGWHISGVAGLEIIWHNGETGGYHSYLGLDAKNRRAVVILTNTASSIDDIGAHLLERKSPLDPVRQNPRGGADRKAVKLEAKQLEGLTGEYALSPAFSITVTLEDTKLMAQATGQEKFEIYAESENRFFYRIVDAQITFERGDDGKAKRLTLLQNGQKIPGNKVK
jgi:D-alanyl-D-alanine-carboxypeptidase/D-alanyl-D-alanine-endopeptidase